MNTPDEKVITVVLNIHNPERARLLWMALEQEKLVHGCRIERIRDGDYIQLLQDAGHDETNNKEETTLNEDSDYS